MSDTAPLLLRRERSSGARLYFLQHARLTVSVCGEITETDYGWRWFVIPQRHPSEHGTADTLADAYDAAIVAYEVATSKNEKDL